ncbi:hypothetical protein ONS95_010595 [Cadophora gregata]|uniref:uncharacterized protein n=1 Tax=Cadophora gregata TaxID=51156 RepID=UPI0026DB80DA|nr:uncharacterized protein ONS95_010595 [Cadophora gregata]KAK0122354.1 hypothetical protein ONS95_010595 [Cadophora gregata]KAK0127832.1 hypothetical protein ONS96_007334 [Cadophora gregata f. sp. sojae]
MSSSVGLWFSSSPILSRRYDRWARNRSPAERCPALAWIHRILCGRSVLGICASGAHSGYFEVLSFTCIPSLARRRPQHRQPQCQSQGQQAVNMFLSSRNDVVLIVFTLLLHSVTSQRLQEKIAKLPGCSNNCIASAATAAGCAADDFACQCQKPDSILGVVSSVLGSVTSQNKCLVTDCGIVTAASAQVLFRQICGLLKDTPSSSALPAPIESTPAAAPPLAAPPETTTIPPPTSVVAPPPEPTVDFTAPPADPTSTEQVPVFTSSTTTPEPVIQSTTSLLRTTSSTPVPVFTLPPQTTLQSTTSPPPHSTSSTTPPSSNLIPFTSSTIPRSSTSSAVQESLASTIQSTSSSTSTSISTSSSVQAALLASSTSATFMSQSATRLLPSTSQSGTSYQAEANQATPTAQKMATKRMSPAIIAAIVLGVLSFVILCTFILFLFRRRQQSLKKKRAFSTMTAMSRKSGEEITIYLDLGGEGRNLGGVGKKKVEFRDSEVGVGAGAGFGVGTRDRAKSIPLSVTPSLPMMERARGFNFKFNLKSGLNSFRRDP